MLQARKRAFGALAALLILASSTALAQEPVIVLSIKSADALVNDLKYVLSTAGIEQDTVDGLIDQMTQGKGLEGIDRSRPLGAYMTIDSTGAPSFVIFIPVNDNNAFRDLLDTIHPPLRDAAGGIFSIGEKDQKLIGKFANGHCFVTPESIEALKVFQRLPDPAKIASSKYSFGIDANLAKIKDEVKDGLVEQLEAALTTVAEGQDQQLNEIQVRVRDQTQKLMVEMMRMLIKETDRLTFGLDIDQKTKTVALDMNVVARNGTPLANSMAAYSKTVSAFAALAGPEAAGSLTFAMPLSKEMRGLFRETIQSNMDQARADIDKADKLQDDQKKIRKELLDIVVKAIEVTGDTGKVDVALAINTAGDDKAQIVGAASIAQGDELAKSIDDLVKQHAGQPGIEKVKLDVAKQGETRIHAIEVELSEELQQSISPGPAHVAIRGDAILFAIGGDSLAAVKAAIDKTGKAGAGRPPVSIRAQPSKLVAMFGKGDDENIKMAREAFAGDGDHLSFELQAVERGARLRLELGEGFLRFIALAVSRQLDGQQR